MNSISKPKIVFHKYASGIRKIYIKSGGQTRPITKNRRGESLRYSNKVLSRSTPLRFIALSAILLCFALIAVASLGARAGGTWFMKNSGGSGLEESGIPSGTSS